MRHTAYKYVAWIWMAALLSATVGISVHRIYCFCVGETTVSFFAGEDACAAPVAVPSESCCKKVVTRSCCEKPEQDAGCTKETVEVVQLKAEFIVEQAFTFEKSFDFPAWIQDMPMFKRLTRPVLCDAAFSVFPQPPPLSGRDICLLHSTIRC